MVTIVIALSVFSPVGFVPAILKIHHSPEQLEQIRIDVD
jgi:hypothetical protein